MMTMMRQMKRIGMHWIIIIKINNQSWGCCGMFSNNSVLVLNVGALFLLYVVCYSSHYLSWNWVFKYILSMSLNGSCAFILLQTFTMVFCETMEKIQDRRLIYWKYSVQLNSLITNSILISIQTAPIPFLQPVN